MEVDSPASLALERASTTSEAALEVDLTDQIMAPLSPPPQVAATTASLAPVAAMPAPISPAAPNSISELPTLLVETLDQIQPPPMPHADVEAPMARPPAILPNSIDASIAVQALTNGLVPVSDLEALLTGASSLESSESTTDGCLASDSDFMTGGGEVVPLPPSLSQTVEPEPLQPPKSRIKASQALQPTQGSPEVSAFRTSPLQTLQALTEPSSPVASSSTAQLHSSQPSARSQPLTPRPPPPPPLAPMTPFGISPRTNGVLATKPVASSSTALGSAAAIAEPLAGAIASPNEQQTRLPRTLSNGWKRHAFSLVVPTKKRLSGDSDPVYKRARTVKSEESQIYVPHGTLFDKGLTKPRPFPAGLTVRNLHYAPNHAGGRDAVMGKIPSSRDIAPVVAPPQEVNPHPTPETFTRHSKKPLRNRKQAQPSLPLPVPPREATPALDPRPKAPATADDKQRLRWAFARDRKERIQEEWEADERRRVVLDDAHWESTRKCKPALGQSFDLTRTRIENVLNEHFAAWIAFGSGFPTALLPHLVTSQPSFKESLKRASTEEQLTAFRARCGVSTVRWRERPLLAARGNAGGLRVPVEDGREWASREPAWDVSQEVWVNEDEEEEIVRQAMADDAEDAAAAVLAAEAVGALESESGAASMVGSLEMDSNMDAEGEEDLALDAIEVDMAVVEDVVQNPAAEAVAPVEASAVPSE